ARDGSITYESPAVERVLGYQAEDRIGQSAIDAVHPDDRVRIGRLFLTVAHRPNAEASAELRVRHADGSWRSIEAVVKNLVDDPAVGGLVANYRDVTARKALETELRVRAFHDALTGLANRALFVDRLEHAIARTSVGVATVHGRRSSADELLRDADAAMYIAKSRGKDRIVVFEPGMHRAALTRLALKGDLERALERKEFRLVYQPIVDLGTG